MARRRCQPSGEGTSSTDVMRSTRARGEDRPPAAFPVITNPDIVRTLVKFVADKQFLFFAPVCRAWREGWGHLLTVARRVSVDTTVPQLLGQLRVRPSARRRRSLHAPRGLGQDRAASMCPRERLSVGREDVLLRSPFRTPGPAEVGLGKWLPVEQRDVLVSREEGRAHACPAMGPGKRVPAGQHHLLRSRQAW
ncbi:unnamed protein product [Scytosiphon promiscuus]